MTRKSMPQSVTDVVQGADVGMADRRQQLCLVQQATTSVVVGAQMPRQYLESDRAPKALVDGAVDLPHTAGANELANAVPAESGADLPSLLTARGLGGRLSRLRVPP